eukprot:SAG31_NODE_1096_length_9920_cov_14.794216_2_plen_63_part_00
MADVPASERPALFTKKLKECCEVYDFRSDENPEAKEMKRQGECFPAESPLYAPRKPGTNSCL